MNTEILIADVTSKGVRFKIPDIRGKFKLRLTVDEDSSRNIIGFTFRAERQGEAEFFCLTFPEALARGRGQIRIFSAENGTDTLVITNDLCPFQPAIIRFPLDEKAGRKMRDYAKKGDLVEVSDLRPSAIGFMVRF